MTTYIGWRRKLYSFLKRPPLGCYSPRMDKSCGRVGESVGYVRGSNIYVRGYLDLRAWSLRLRT